MSFASDWHNCERKKVMKTILLCLALSWVSYAIVYIRTRLRGGTFVEPVANLVACTVASALAGFFIAIGISCAVPNKTTEVSRQLVAIRSANGKTGAFFYPASAVLGIPAYRVYTKNVDGSLSAQILPSNTFIIESAELNNEAIWRKTSVNKDSSSALYHWSISLNGDWDIRNYIVLPAGSFVP